MSGGNKRHRKKCRWNICHLGINVVQSKISTLKKIPERCLGCVSSNLRGD